MVRVGEGYLFAHLQVRRELSVPGAMGGGMAKKAMPPFRFAQHHRRIHLMPHAFGKCSGISFVDATAQAHPTAAASGAGDASPSPGAAGSIGGTAGATGRAAPAAVPALIAARLS